mgnify:CR=1 FL=1
MNKEINKVDNFLDLQNFDSFLKIRGKEASWLREKRKISYCKLKGAKVPSKKVENGQKMCSPPKTCGQHTI